jgi:hypothetical protein
MFPQYADRYNLMPMYKRVNEAIRKNDPDRIVFFENSIGASTELQNGFDEGPGGRESNHKQAFSYHIYCLQNSSNGDPLNRTTCDCKGKGGK